MKQSHMLLKIQVNNYLFILIFKIIVYAVVANKNDMYMEEEIKNTEGENLAKQYNGIFQITSAKEGYGINELFEKITDVMGEIMFGNGKYDINDINQRHNIILNKKQIDKMKRKCC